MSGIFTPCVQTMCLPCFLSAASGGHPALLLVSHRGARLLEMTFSPLAACLLPPCLCNQQAGTCFRGRCCSQCFVGAGRSHFTTAVVALITSSIIIPLADISAELCFL